MQTIHIIPNQEKQHKHQKTSEQLAKQVEEFLANGGKIQQIPTGLSANKDVHKKYMSTVKRERVK